MFLQLMHFLSITASSGSMIFLNHYCFHFQISPCDNLLVQCNRISIFFLHLFRHVLTASPDLGFYLVAVIPVALYL